MNYGFEQMTYVFPDSFVDIEEIVDAAGFDEAMAERIKSGGLHRIPAGSGEPLSDLVRNAVEKIVELGPDIPVRTYGVIFAHSVPVFAPAGLSFLDLCTKGQGFINVPKFTVSGQPCSILHMAVQLSGYWLKDAPDNFGILLIGADQAYSAEERIYFGSTMGDVAFAGFITRDADKNRVLSTISQCAIITYNGEDSPQEDIARFREMNPLYIRKAIEDCLNEGEVELDDLDYIVPHTPYLMMSDIIAEVLRFPRDKILTNYIHETGHLSSNDSFVHYTRAVQDGIIKADDVAVLINPGFGGTRGCTLIQC